MFNKHILSFYHQDLQCLIERYLEPLQEETYLSGEDIQQLFGNIQEIVAFQKLFLLSLQDAVELEPNFSMLTDPVAFKVTISQTAIQIRYPVALFRIIFAS